MVRQTRTNSFTAKTGFGLLGLLFLLLVTDAAATGQHSDTYNAEYGVGKLAWKFFTLTCPRCFRLETMHKLISVEVRANGKLIGIKSRKLDQHMTITSLPCKYKDTDLEVIVKAKDTEGSPYYIEPTIILKDPDRKKRAACFLSKGLEVQPVAPAEVVPAVVPAEDSRWPVLLAGAIAALAVTFSVALAIRHILRRPRSVALAITFSVAESESLSERTGAGS